MRKKYRYLHIYLHFHDKPSIKYYLYLYSDPIYTKIILSKLK